MKRKPTVIIIGSNGQLGSDLREELSGWPVTALGGPPEKDIDITDIQSIRKAFTGISPAFVINTAAYTNVPACEDFVDLAFRVNAEGAENVARVCLETGARLIHLSTDYVFDGEKGSPYREEDKPHPLNQYGRSKIKGEQLIAETMDDFYIMRTSGLYGKAGCLVKGENFVEKMMRFYHEKRDIKVVDDEILTPTSSRSLSRQIVRLMEESPPPGIYHATNQGQCSWFEFTCEIFRTVGFHPEIEPVHQEAFPSLVNRPRYSVLENHALKRQGIDIMEDWHDALKEFFEPQHTSFS